MLTLEEIQESSPDPEVAKEILRQAELRMSDALAIAKGFETKATIFFGIYVTIIAGLSGYVLKEWDHLPTYMLVAAFLTALMFWVGLLHCIRILHPKRFGIIGTNVQDWIIPELITSDRSKVNLAILMCYRAAHYIEHINVSDLRNQDHASSLFWAMLYGYIAPFVGVLSYVVFAEWLHWY